MAVNYAEKYSNKVDERFNKASITDRAVNKEYDWVGVSTVNVYGVSTAPMNDYDVTAGSNRYGAPGELSNSKQELTLRKDRSFTFTIDRKNYDDTQMTVEAGKALRRQIDEVVIPEVDAYRIAEMATNAGTKVVEAITSSNAYEAFLDGTIALNDANVPLTGRIAYISGNFYKNIRLDSSFIKASDIAQDMLVKGAVGMVEGVLLIPTPSSYLPANTEFLITHSVATTAAQKLEQYKTHDNPPGINGWLVEGRVRYDAFVLNNKADAIYLHSAA